MDLKSKNEIIIRDIILNFPKQFKIGWDAGKNVKITGEFKGVLICGMGGSALPADIFEMWLKNYQINLPLYVHRNYSLPFQINNEYLVVCISYSGNTEETLSAFRTALEKNFKVAAIASGGELEAMCKKYNIPLAKVPANYPPRISLGYQFAALMRILANCQLIKVNPAELLSLEKELKPESLRSEGENLAKKLKNKTPLIYASEEKRALARIWKIKFNETAKILAFYNYFPELDHHEINGFENPQGKFSVIILRDPTDHPRVLKRMEITADLIKKGAVNTNFIEIEGKSILVKIFQNLLLADWTSYFLAKEYGTDPKIIKLVEKLKICLKSKK